MIASDMMGRIGPVLGSWRDRAAGVLSHALSQSESRITSDAQSYWRQAADQDWRGNAHWRESAPFSSGDLWTHMGMEHLDLIRQAARAIELEWERPRIVDWGCGGGANAVHLAPLAHQLVGVDVSPETLEECARQVAAVCETPFLPVLVDVSEPEAALARITPCDLFVSFYVFELIPSPEYGERLLRIAAEALVPGGLAVIQIRYSDGTWHTRSRRRAYRENFARMTTYSIPEFWQLAQESGLTPRMLSLVPRNELDERYAYFVLTKASASSGS